MRYETLLTGGTGPRQRSRQRAPALEAEGGAGQREDREVGALGSGTAGADVAAARASIGVAAVEVQLDPGQLAPAAERARQLGLELGAVGAAGLLDLEDDHERVGERVRRVDVAEEHRLAAFTPVEGEHLPVGRVGRLAG